MSNKLYYTPGPAQLFHTVPYHLQQALKEDIASISHRSKEFESVVIRTKKNLRSLLDIPDNYEIFFTSSANEIWERIIQNLIIHSSHHFVNGAFSKKFYSFTQSYRKTSSQTVVGDGHEFTDMSVPNEAELISVTINETSIGYQFDQENLKQLRNENPDKLISADIVSATPSIPLDLSLVDTAYFSVQKCFGLPAGLGVWLVNDRCIDRSNQISHSDHITGSYHSIHSLLNKSKENQTPETPNMLGIYLLMKVTGDMLERGVKSIRNETIYKSTLIYQLMEELDWMKPFISSKINRSKTVCVAEVPLGNEKALEHFSRKNIQLGKGYGPYKKNHIRIANFPTHSKEQIEMMVDFFKSI